MTEKKIDIISISNKYIKCNFASMPIINTTISFHDNVLSVLSYFEEIEETIKESESEISRKKYSSIVDPDGNKPEIEINKCISYYIKKIDKYKKIIDRLSEIPSALSEITGYFISYIASDVGQYILKQTQLIALKIKKLIYFVHTVISEYTKIILQFCVTGTGGQNMTILIRPVIALFNKISKSISAVLKGLEQSINLMHSTSTINAESLSFFLTPKSMQNVRMKILNSNESAVYKLPPQITDRLSNILTTSKQLNIPVKISAVAAGAALGAAAVKSNDDFDISCSDLSVLDPKNILKLIEDIVKAIPVSEPLPKYENLSIDNLGFLTWLISGFCPAGKQSFGIPGQS